MNACEGDVQMDDPADIGPQQVIELCGSRLRKYGA